MKINKMIADIVEQRGIKQTYIAERTGLTVDAVSRIMRSERKLGAEEFLKICELLNVSPESFSVCIDAA